MRKFVLEKILHKKWMCICLLIGNILLIGMAVSNPMYYHAALNRTLQTELKNASLPKEVRNIGEVTISGRLGKSGDTQTTKYAFQTGDYKNPDTVCDMLQKNYEIPALAKSALFCFPSSKVSKLTLAEIKKSDRFCVSYLTELEEHSNLVAGDWCPDTVDAGKPVPCVVGERTMMQRELMIGQRITLEQVVEADSKEPLTFEIVGVFSEKEEDVYWMEDTSKYYSELFVSEEMFRYCLDNVLFKGGNDTVVRFHTALDTTKITDYNYKKIMDDTNKLKKEFQGDASVQVTTGFYNILSEYGQNRGGIRMVMLILQVPLLVLLAIFIFMVSKQMLSMEENEIAMLKSRGGSRRQILSIYVIQSAMIAILSMLLGIPLGMLFCNLIGSASSFLQFVSRKNLQIYFSWDILLYLLAVILFSVAVMVLPVISISKLTIVEYKQGQKRQKKALWKKLFLDIILLAVSGYVYYNYTQQKEALSMKIAEGGDIDYMLLLSSSLFILGCGLLALRIMPRLVWLIFTIGKRFWKPEVYASFLQIIRTSNKQEFISLFLILTIALGIFNATTASTINQNKEEEIKFKNGSDITIMEEWESNLPVAIYNKETMGVDIKIKYTEADYEKYQNLNKDVEGMTRVYYNDAVLADITNENVSGFRASQIETQVLAIEPKSFGECCWFRDDLAEKHWYHWLNLLADNYDGILISKSLAEAYDIEIGDDVYCDYQDAMGRHQFEQSTGKVVGIVDYWPTMENETMVINKKGKVEKKTQYYMIANFECVMSCTGVQPYSILMKTKDGNTQPIYDFIHKENIKVKTFQDTPNDLLKAKNDPIYQSTNGILTLGFLVVIILCTTGFLIYWILSIRSRELLFGIYRAMGLSRQELKKMLINEHIFSTLFSILTGAVVGYITSLLFVPIMEITYLPGSQIIPLRMVVEIPDMVKLGSVICLMVVVCIIVLMKLVSRLKISQALKLGED